MAYPIEEGFVGATQQSPADAVAARCCAAVTGFDVHPVAVNCGMFWPREGLRIRPGRSVIEFLPPVPPEADPPETVARLEAMIEGRSDALGPLMRRIETQGIAPVTICIAALRHVRALHLAASDPGGAAAGLSRLRPPVFGPRRDRMARQAQGWGMRALEDAMHELVGTDLTLRSSSRAPAMAVMERALIRLAMMPRGTR